MILMITDLGGARLREREAEKEQVGVKTSRIG